MFLSTRNFLLDATSVTLTGSAGGGAITDINVLRRPYVGDPFVMNKYSVAVGGAKVNFTLPSAQSIRALYLASWISGSSDYVEYEVRNGGSGGTLMASGVMPAPAAPTNVYGRRMVQVRAIDLFASTAGSAGYTADWVSFDIQVSAGIDPAPYQLLRCGACNGLRFLNYVDKLCVRDGTTGDRSQVGQWNGVEGSRKREVEVVIDRARVTGTFGPLSTAALDSFAELVAYAGALPEVLLIHPQPNFNILGKFVERATIEPDAGPNNNIRFKVRDF